MFASIKELRKRVYKEYLKHVNKSLQHRVEVSAIKSKGVYIVEIHFNDPDDIELCQAVCDDVSKADKTPTRVLEKADDADMYAVIHEDLDQVSKQSFRN